MVFDIGVNPFYSATMEATLTLDKAGRLVIPKPLRDELRLEAGDKLTIKSEGDGFTVHPLRSHSTMRKKDGIWVFTGGGGKLTAEDASATLDEIRAERDRHNLEPAE